ncbi:alpha/beta fold hydrolase [Rhodococcus sp. NPDC059968]|uniref:alpha/beta fold hydrolase n=1 Tax=Rhodococcus sp. NPDC059968 TaxID=3347017 RepID=UPI00366BB85B
MPYANIGPIELCYEITGPEDGEPLLLIHGLGAQLVAWYPGFCRALEDEGFRVIRFDNRDVGLSSKLNDTPDYHLQDMTSDVEGLLVTLGLDAVHVVGQSMGGMIAQQLAIAHPERVRSLCSIYSAPSTEFLTQELQAVLQRPPILDREGTIRQWIETERLSGLDGFDESRIYDFAAAIYDRSYCPAGFERQSRALLTAPDQRPGLAQLTIPMAVIHGRDDRLISYRGGIATAMAVPGAELHLYAGMGHQVTPHLWSDYVRVITRNIERAEPDRTEIPTAAMPYPTSGDRGDASPVRTSAVLAEAI